MTEEQKQAIFEKLANLWTDLGNLRDSVFDAGNDGPIIDELNQFQKQVLEVRDLVEKV